MKKYRGYIIIGVGLVMILINAVSYVFDFYYVHPSFGAIGLIFAAVGAMLIRKSEKS